MCARYDEEWIASLLDAEDRLGDTTPEQCLRDAGVSAGQTVVDYGCGPGLFTFPAAEIVGPSGVVYAVDIEPRMTALIANRAAELGVHNVAALLNEGAAPLPDGAADFLILAQVLHYPDDRDDRVAMARDVARLLKAGGRALVVEWKPDGEADGGSHPHPDLPPSRGKEQDGIPPERGKGQERIPPERGKGHGRMPPEEAARIVGEAGLKAGEPYSLGPRQYAFVAARG